MNNIKSKYTILHDRKDKSRWFVRLEDDAGIFAGVVCGYGKFSVKEPTDAGGSLMFNFERDILYVPENLRGKELSEDKELEFTHLLGSILYDILEANLDKVSERGDRLILELDNDDK